MEDSGMSCTTFGNRAIDDGLGPMCRLEVEDDQIGEIGSMFVFSTEYEEFVALVESSSMTWSALAINDLSIIE